MPYGAGGGSCQEGYGCDALGTASHAGGYKSIAKALFSFVHGVSGIIDKTHRGSVLLCDASATLGPWDGARTTKSNQLKLSFVNGIETSDKTSMASENGNVGMIGTWQKPYETGSFNRLIAYPDLKAKYMFEQNANDSSFCGNNATPRYTNGAQYILSGFNGGYALYVGAFNYSGVISLPQKILDVLSGPEWTVEYMTKQDKSVSSIGASTYSFSLSAGSTSKPLGLYTNPLSSSADYPVFGGNYNVYITGTSRPVQEWTTNTITFESGLFLYYKNNMLMGSGVASQSQFTWVSGIIGGYANDGLAWFHPHPGYIDNFKVWNRAVISGYNYSDESRAITLEKDTYLVPENNLSTTLGRHNKQFANVFSPVTAKAWCSYNGRTQKILSSFNISSVLRVGTGNYRFYFLNNMSSANYCVLFGFTSDGVINNAWQNTPKINVKNSSYFEIHTLGDSPNGSIQDQLYDIAILSI